LESRTLLGAIGEKRLNTTSKVSFLALAVLGSAAQPARSAECRDHD